ncbi:cbb3-type cytochrome c oxidase subunit I [Sphingobacterium sp. lm-10]|uniref:cytochrome c oxidase subunit I n=1 Tax=Sphingobacterium sp. lm-10 TaxID=2944904 RepID=UPI002021A1F9|nr:cbb3-type cytochrome c oxidase subunit I [Sphingobacterium sp. lm-10]MCL7988726.1 cbb3-type cytochrome c oxidase subunit I [Sphingobacterium sp. lm-10]
MSTTVISHGAADHDSHDHHHHHETFLTKYVFSQDHKMIAKQFLITGIIMAVFAMILSILFRIQLAWPDAEFPILEVFLGKWAEGGRIKADFFLSLVTIHGTMMVFFVLTAGLSGTFSNLLIPYQIGARDMASPLMNMLSYWFFFVACVIMIASFFVESGPASAGWTIYPPLSAVPTAISGSGLGMTLWLASMVLFIASQVLGGTNYVSTILNMRTKGMDLWKMPLTIWAFFLTAIVGLLSFPVLVSAVVLLIFDRSAGTSFYLSDLVVGGQILPNEGGSPILFQHLFWFLGHPEVYIVVMPALGLTSEVISTNARKPIFGYHAMVYSLVGITVLSFIVWGHHMFVTGMSPFLGGVFMITTLIIAVPSAVKAFNYIATLWRGNIRFTPAMLFAIGMVSFFVSGGVTGIFLGNAALDINLHDTYFVVAHFHLVMGSASIFGMLCGVYHWYPKMFGRMMDERLGYLHFWVTFVGAYMVFFPMHFMGIDGVPRRYYSFTEFPFMEKWVSVNILVTWAAIIAALGQVAFLWNFFSSIWLGKRAPQNPWNSNTLEWTTPVEHFHGNWPGEIPAVYRWPYDYSKPGHDEDFIPQHIPYSQTMSSNQLHDFEGDEEAIRIQKAWNTENNREETIIH